MDITQASLALQYPDVFISFQCLFVFQYLRPFLFHKGSKAFQNGVKLVRHKRLQKN